MDVTAILFIAFGLAMDAFAVSIMSGATAKRLNINHALRMAVSFGSFQAFMPLIGWSVGFGLKDLVSGIDHWIAFGLLVSIGLKMIYEARRLDLGKKENDLASLNVLLMLSVATSIDALAVGLSFAFLAVVVVAPATVIGIATFLLSFLGVCAGSKIGHLFESRIEVVGGLTLIGIGVKILVEHLL